MRVLLVALLVGAPEGFRESVRLAPIAMSIAGQPSVVSCARTASAWEGLLKPYDLPAADVDGLTIYDHQTAYFAPRTCRDLEGWLRGKAAPTAAHLGEAVLSLTHEAMHLRGVRDERTAECGALQRLRSVLRTYFGVRREATMRAALAAARRINQLKPAAYRC